MTPAMRKLFLDEAQTITKTPDGQVLVNGLPAGIGEGEATACIRSDTSARCPAAQNTGPLGPLEFFSTLQQSEVVLWGSQTIREADGIDDHRLLPEADARQPGAAAGRAPDVPGHPQRASCSTS